MRCDGVGPTSPQPVMARASSLWTAISHRDRSTDVTSGHGAPAAATMIDPAAFHDPAAARVAAAARPGRALTCSSSTYALSLAQAPRGPGARDRAKAANAGASL
eukprot:COSAG06_NODE_239_length_19404_cov_12.723284_25_plen_104_part_00